MLTFFAEYAVGSAAFKPQPHDWPFLIAAANAFDTERGRREGRRERRDYYWRERGDCC